MPEMETYGIFGDLEVERDDNGFIEVLVIFEESGLYFGASPAELRIHNVGSPSKLQFFQRYAAKLNRKADLPFYLATAKIKVTGDMQRITDGMILAEGLEPLKD